MANVTPVKGAITIPPDAALAAGMPVAAGGVRGIVQSIRHLFELVNDGPAPGENTSVLDGSQEWLRPHDHSGAVGDYNHGIYLMHSVHPELNKLARDPAAAWIADFEADQGGFISYQPDDSTPWPAFWDNAYGNNWWILAYTKAYSVVTANHAAWCGMAKIRLPRGTNQITVRQLAAQADDHSSLLTPGEIWWALTDTSHNLVDSTSATLDNTIDVTAATYMYEQSGTLDVAAASATLTVDTDFWLYCGLKALDTTGNKKYLVCSQSLNYYTSQV